MIKKSLIIFSVFYLLFISLGCEYCSNNSNTDNPLIGIMSELD